MDINTHSLSNQEVEILKYLNSSRPIAFLSSNDKWRKYEVLKSFMFQKLSEGNGFLLRVSDKEHTYEILRQWNLESLCLDLRKDTLIHKEQLEINFVHDRTYQIEAIKANARYFQALQKLKNMQDTYNEPVFGEYGRTKLSELLYLSSKRKLKHKLDLDLPTSNYRYDQKEFWHIRTKIEKAAKYHKTSYNYLKSSDDFSSHIYKDFHLTENQEVVFRHLNRFLLTTEQLTSRYRSEFEKISQKLYQAYHSKVALISKLSDDLELHLNFYQIELDLAPKKNLFQRNADPIEKQKKELRSRYQLLIDAIAEAQVIKINSPENSWTPDVSILSKFNIDLQKHLKNAHITIRSKVEEQLEIINANNYEAPELQLIHKEQKELVNAINESNLFANEFNNLSISSWKNYGFLRVLKSQLSKSKLFLQANLDYAIYRSFENSLERNVLDVIQSLSNIKPHLWTESFEAWYFKALFDKYFLHDLVGIESKYDDLESLKFDNQQYETYRINSCFEQENKQKSGLSKKVGKEGLDWKSAMISDPSSFKKHFPILLCDEQFFASEIANLDYEYLVCLENKDIPLNLFSNSSFDAIVCMNDLVHNKKLVGNASQANHYESVKQFNLKSKAIPADLKLNDSLSYNLTIGKYLTFVLKESSYEKQFFSAKNFSVITCMSEFSSKLIELEMLEHKIKSLKYTSIESGIVDDIIIKEDQSKYLIIQDGFLDPAIDLEWQISVLRSLRQAGIKVLIFNTFELALAGGKRILDLLEIKELSGLVNRPATNEA